MSEPSASTPDWVKKAVFYQIFPDRFAWSPHVTKPGNFEAWDSAPTPKGFKGGDLLGVYEKLDYLEDLGIDAIYFNPIFQSASNHRYHTHDYYQVDPLLGGNAAFRTLLDEAHKRGIRVVLDGVFNHSSRGFFQFNHILETEEKSPYLDWFFIHGFPLNAYNGVPNYDCWWALPGLPKFNTGNPQVRKFIMDVARYWIDQGADGWRLDVPFEIDDDSFWQEFRAVVKDANPEAYIVGEIPSEAQRWLRGDQFDGVMNYQLTLACLSFFGGACIDKPLAEGMMGLELPGSTDAAHFMERVSHLLTIYPHENALAQLNLLSSHDMPRFLSLVSNETNRLWLAYLFLLTYPGAPCIYYGDEIGLTGGKDPDCRKAFPWDKADWNQDLRTKLRELVLVRHALPALQTGSFEPLFTEGNVLAYVRADAEEHVLVVINASETSHTLNLPVASWFAQGTELQDQLSSQHVTVQDGSIAELKLPPLSAYIFA